jgi:hypothetical protein
MKTIGALLVTLIGVAAIVFGVLFIMEAGNSTDELAAEISPLTTSQVNATYDQISAALKASPQDVSLALQKGSLALAKSTLSTIDFVQKSGILSIIMGAGFVLTGLLFMKRD